MDKVQKKEIVSVIHIHVSSLILLTTNCKYKWWLFLLLIISILVY